LADAGGWDKVLQFEDDGRFAVVLGELTKDHGDGEASASPALVQLRLKGVFASPEDVIKCLPKLQLRLTNFSGAEYSYYDACLPLEQGGGAVFSTEVIWPASDRQIGRKMPSHFEMVEEDAQIYEEVVRAHAVAESAKLGWVLALCSLEKERERNLFVNEKFVINVDTKWVSHPDLEQARKQPDGSFGPPPFEWRGAAWTNELYILGISRDPTLLSLRDLEGEKGAQLVEEMRDELRKAAFEVYGVPASKLRVFFHYHPQFYRLHAHCCRSEWVNPGSEVERAHLLTDVAQNLRLDAGFYKRATLTYKLRVGEKLHALLHASQAFHSLAGSQ